MSDEDIKKYFDEAIKDENPQLAFTIIFDLIMEIKKLLSKNA